MSRRTLQRELRLHGTTYQLLVERFRARHATILLRERRLETKDIAFVLGFQDVGSFRRAFQRWTGCAVGEWIKAQGLA
jgi:AraC-like DNA-binding protein